MGTKTVHIYANNPSPFYSDGDKMIFNPENPPSFHSPIKNNLSLRYKALIIPII